MLQIDCSELSPDEKLTLASEISDALEGRALALVKLDAIVFDQLSDEKVGVDTLQPIVSDFVSREERLAVLRSGGERGDRDGTFGRPHRGSEEEDRVHPAADLRQCPYCSFITQYEEEYTVHVRAHLFGV